MSRPKKSHRERNKGRITSGPAQHNDKLCGGGRRVPRHPRLDEIEAVAPLPVEEEDLA